MITNTNDELELKYSENWYFQRAFYISRSDTAIKNNIMYALTDMCVRYASLVDPLLPQMTACLKEK